MCAGGSGSERVQIAVSVHNKPRPMAVTAKAPLGGLCHLNMFCLQNLGFLGPGWFFKGLFMNGETQSHPPCVLGGLKGDPFQKAFSCVLNNQQLALILHTTRKRDQTRAP